jgi:very-short-patch-repair endonuclease
MLYQGMPIARARQLRQRMPPAEAAMWNALRSLKAHGLHFRRQVPLGAYYADFLCHHPKLVIEVDGWTHDDKDYDDRRDAFMTAEGYRVLRVSNDDVRFALPGVIELVLRATGRQ